MRAKELTKEQPRVSYIVYVNGKPGTTHEDYISAKWQIELLAKDLPNYQYEIKKEVCQIEPAQPKTVTEKWSEKYKRSINCSNPQGFSQRAHCQGRKKKQISESENSVANFKNILKEFLPFIKQELGLNSLPKIKIKAHVPTHDQPTFGRYNNKTQTLEIGIINRQPMDILRTMAHELVHYRQQLKNQLEPGSGDTGSPEENEANAVAGIIMRKFGKQHPELFHEAPMVKETIQRVGNRYRLVSKKSGRNLGTFDTRAEAEKRERQVQFFKHKK